MGLADGTDRRTPGAQRSTAEVCRRAGGEPTVWGHAALPPPPYLTRKLMTTLTTQANIPGLQIYSHRASSLSNPPRSGFYETISVCDGMNRRIIKLHHQLDVSNTFLS